VNTEITNKTVWTADRGVICYDGNCAFCLATVDRIRPFFEHRGFTFAKQQQAHIRQRIGLAEDQPPDRMWLLLPDGTAIGGGDPGRNTDVSRSEKDRCF